MRVVNDISKKPVEESASCAECEQLKDDKGTLRCAMYGGSIVEDTTEKHCKDSIR